MAYNKSVYYKVGDIILANINPKVPGELSIITEINSSFLKRKHLLQEGGGSISFVGVETSIWTKVYSFTDELEEILK